jgi:hypothetical protein
VPFGWTRKVEPSVAAAPSPSPSPSPEPDARAIMIRVMRVAPDARYRAARQLGLLEGSEHAAGPELERHLLQRAYTMRMLGALEAALSR